MWRDQPHSREEQVFCSPGQQARPTSCTEHPEHRWCHVCEGWFPALHVAHSPRLPVDVLGAIA
jgi:hypothetical protein